MCRALMGKEGEAGWGMLGRGWVGGAGRSWHHSCAEDTLQELGRQDLDSKDSAAALLGW